MQLSLSLWLLVLLGINRKIKCFPAVVFACHGNVHTPHCQHLYAALKTCYLVGAVHCEAEVSLRAEWSQAYFRSLFKCSPSQLDALRLAALQLDTGSLSLWTSSFLVPGGHYMPLLLKACCSACCSLNGAEEADLAIGWLHGRPLVLVGCWRPRSGPQMGW